MKLKTQLQNNLQDDFLSLINLWLYTNYYSYKYAIVSIKL